MEARIKQELAGKKASEVVELNLDSVEGETLVGITDDFTTLESLSLNNCGLTTLKGFPKLDNLKNLELGDNKFKEGFEPISNLPKLVFLNLADNPITDVQALKPLKKLTNLIELDLFSVEISIGKGKREKIFEIIPSLVYLDGCDKDDKPKEECEEEEDDEENGKYDDMGSDEEDMEGEELEEEDDEEEDVSLTDLYNKSLNDTEEGDEDFEGEGEGEEDDVEDELDEEEDDDGDDVKNLSKESVEEPRKKKQKVANGKSTGSAKK